MGNSIHSILKVVPNQKQNQKPDAVEQLLKAIRPLLKNGIELTYMPEGISANNGMAHCNYLLSVHLYRWSVKKQGPESVRIQATPGVIKFYVDKNETLDTLLERERIRRQIEQESALEEVHDLALAKAVQSMRANLEEALSFLKERSPRGSANADFSVEVAVEIRRGALFKTDVILSTQDREWREKLG